MSYDFVCTIGKSIVLEGECLSLAGLKRAMDMMNEYAGFVEIVGAVHSVNEEPKNKIKYVPVQDFRLAKEEKTAALIDLENDDEDDDEDDDDEEDEDDDEDDFDPMAYLTNLFS